MEAREKGYLFIPALLLISVGNADFFKYLRKDGRINSKGLCLVTVLWTVWAAAKDNIHGRMRSRLIAIGATLATGEDWE
jgi:hypothetical protein